MTASQRQQQQQEEDELSAAFSGLHIREGEPEMRRAFSGCNFSFQHVAGSDDPSGHQHGAKATVTLLGDKGSCAVNMRKIEQEREQRRVLALGKARNEKDTQSQQGNDDQQHPQQQDQEEEDSAAMDPFAITSVTPPEQVNPALLPEFVKLLFHTSEPSHVLHGMRCIRKLLSVATNPPVDRVIESGVVLAIVQLLVGGVESGVLTQQLLFETSWVLTNIASGTDAQTAYLAQQGVIAALLNTVSSNADFSSSLSIRESLAWLVGNVAGGGVEMRNYLLSLNAHRFLAEMIISIYDVPEALTALRNATWAVGNLCRSKPAPSFDIVVMLLPVLARLVHHNDEEVMTDALWALSYVSDGDDRRVQALLDIGVLPRIVHCLSHPMVSMQNAAVRTIGNLVTGNSQQTRMVINSGALPSFIQLVRSPKRTVVKEAVWAISNMAADSPEIIKALVESGVMKAAVEQMDSPHFEICKEATWIVANTTSGAGNDEVIDYLVSECRAIPRLIGMLRKYDARTILVALEGLENILAVGERTRGDNKERPNRYVAAFADSRGVGHLEELQQHTDHEVSTKSCALWAQYFEEAAPEGGESDSNTKNDQGFSF